MVEQMDDWLVVTLASGTVVRKVLNLAVRLVGAMAGQKAVLWVV